MNANLLQFVLLILKIYVSLKTALSNRTSQNCLPTSCADILVQGNTVSGIYTVYPKQWFGKSNISVYCDMETDGGGWTVFQRRVNTIKQQNFIQNWNTYKKGFGSLEKDFWLGNDNIYILSNQEYVSLRVDMENYGGEKAFALYNQFRISGCHDKYRLHVKDFSGSTVDSLTYHDNATFVTFDEGDVYKCSASNKGGRWFKHCANSNLNGLYLKGGGGGVVIDWSGFAGLCLEKTEMKIRPSYFSYSKN